MSIISHGLLQLFRFLPMYSLEEKVVLFCLFVRLYCWGEVCFILLSFHLLLGNFEYKVHGNLDTSLIRYLENTKSRINFK